MTPDDLAALHQRCFTIPRPFTAAEFTNFLTSPTCFLTTAPAGFALGRVAADEAELLTLAVDPDQRRQGIGRHLLDDFHTRATELGARQVYLEVAADNNAARGLYQQAGYCESCRRPGYYAPPSAPRIDAILMTRPLATT